MYSVIYSECDSGEKLDTKIRFVEASSSDEAIQKVHSEYEEYENDTHYCFQIEIDDVCEVKDGECFSLIHFAE